MALQFAQILNAEASASCSVPGMTDKLDFTYRPNILTPNLLAEFATAKEEQGSTEGFREQFRRFISWWDIEVPQTQTVADAAGNTVEQPVGDASGQPVMVNLPITEESIKAMGFFVLQAIFAAAIEAAKPGEAQSATS